MQKVRGDLFFNFWLFNRFGCYVYSLDIESIQAYSLDIDLIYMIEFAWRNVSLSLV